MAGLVIKNLLPELYQKLKERARRRHRSMMKEALAGRMGVKEVPPQYKGGVELTDDFLDRAKREGRE